MWHSGAAVALRFKAYREGCCKQASLGHTEQIYPSCADHEPDVISVEDFL